MENGDEPQFQTLQDRPLEELSDKDHRPPLQKQMAFLAEDIINHFQSNEEKSWQITIEAPRGAGKTSALNLLKKELEKPQRERKEELKKIKEELKKVKKKREDELKEREKELEKKILENQQKGSFEFIKFHSWDIPDGEARNARKILGHIATHIAQHFKSKYGHEDKIEELLKYAAQLLLEQGEASQAALAFSTDENDFLDIFRDKLSSIGAAERYFEALQEILRTKKCWLTIMADDVDWRPDLFIEIMTALVHFRHQKRILIVSAVHDEWIEKILRKKMDFLYRDDHMRFHLLSDNEETHLRQSLLGQEFSLYSWTSSRQIAFFVTPRLEVNKSKGDELLDGRCIWSWFLGNKNGMDVFDEGEFCAQYSDNAVIQDHIKKHMNFVFDLCCIDAFLGEKAGTPDAKEAYWEAYKAILPDCVTQEKFQERLNKFKEIYSEGNWDSVNPKNIYFLLLLIFIHGFFPNNARQAIYLTNRLIQVYRQWGSIPFDVTLKKSRTHDRWAKALSFMAIEKWRFTYFGKILRNQAWQFRAGLLNDWLVPDKDKIMEIKNEPEYTTIDSDKIKDEAENDPSSAKIKYKVVKILKCCYEQSK